MLINPSLLSRFAFEGDGEIPTDVVLLQERPTEEQKEGRKARRRGRNGGPKPQLGLGIDNRAGVERGGGGGVGWLVVLAVQ